MARRNCYGQMGVRIVESITLSLGWFSTHHKIPLKTKRVVVLLSELETKLWMLVKLGLERERERERASVLWQYILAYLWQTYARTHWQIFSSDVPFLRLCQASQKFNLIFK
jgi:hypothetical protein